MRAIVAFCTLILERVLLAKNGIDTIHVRT